MIHRIVIGDWSNDGHSQKDFYSFECNADEAAIKKAYLQAVKKSGISLHFPEQGNHKFRAICDAYRDNRLNKNAMDALRSVGVDFTNISIEEGQVGPRDVAKLFFEMVRSQIPGFEFSSATESKPINGFWSEDFNYQIGYGCYSG